MTTWNEINAARKAHNAKATCVKRVGGCKVDWLLYADLDEAKEMAAIARAEAWLLEEKGFDWGFQTPGAIEERNGLYWVTIP